jgi:hypothetical protein
MIRKQVYIEPRHQVILNRLVSALGVTEAEIIRRAIDREEHEAPYAIRDLEAWEKEKAFIGEWVAGGLVSASRQWRREDTYRERLDRHNR